MAIVLAFTFTTGLAIVTSRMANSGQVQCRVLVFQGVDSMRSPELADIALGAATVIDANRLNRGRP